MGISLSRNFSYDQAKFELGETGSRCVQAFLDSVVATLKAVTEISVQ